MIDLNLIRADDRVLWLGAPDVVTIRAISLKLATGLLVAVGPDEPVREGRRALADLENVMLIPESGDGSIPWRDNFFTVLIAAANQNESREARRVCTEEARTISVE